MKEKFFSLVIAACGTTIALGQNTSAIPTENAQWLEMYITFAGPKIWYTTLCGDTTIHQQNWSKVYLVSTDTNQQVMWSIYKGALRSEGKKSWFIPAETSDTVLLYDFDLEAGDTFTLTHPLSTFTEKIVVDFTEEVFIGNALRKVIHFESYPWGYEHEYWVEGIGSNLGLLNRGSGQGPDYGSYLLCFGSANEVVNFSQTPCVFADVPGCPFSSTDEPQNPIVWLFVNPNPANGQAVIDVSANATNDWSLQVFDAHGKSILKRDVEFPAVIQTEEWPAGTYLIVVVNKNAKSVQGSRLLVVQH